MIIAVKMQNPVHGDVGPMGLKRFVLCFGFMFNHWCTNGKITQIDLPKGTRSGLVHVSNVLDNVEGISFTYFDSKDVVRHPIIQKIVEAYDNFDSQNISTLNTLDQDRLNERDN